MSLRSPAKAIFAAVCAAALVGCASSGGDSSSGMQNEGRQVFGDVGAATPQGATTVRPPAWRVALAVFSGPDAIARANQALPIIQGEGRVPEAFVEPRRRGAIIAFGAYDEPGDRAAQRDLTRIREMQINGRPAYPGAFLAPPQGGVSGSNPGWNLANVREQFGESVKYTLQVAVYESNNRAEAMRLAEQAVSIYRRDGELAFYYHGPNRSMVTIGVFTDREFDPASGRISDEIRALQQRHPEHLANGMVMTETLASGATRVQPPQLVRIP
jgi:hypothetical protein